MKDKDFKVEVHELYNLRGKGQAVLGALETAFSSAAQNGDWQKVKDSLRVARKGAAAMYLMLNQLLGEEEKES